MKLTDIKGIGQKTLEILKTQGITDIPSLLYTIPKNYTEYKITPFMYEGEMNVEALVTEEVHLQKLKNATKVSFRVAIEGIPMNVVMFNMVYLKNVLKVGMEIVIVGTYDKDYKTINATKIFKKEEFKEGIIPEYNIEGITNSHFQKIEIEALKQYEEKNNIIPRSYFERHGFTSGKELLEKIHNPKSTTDTLIAINSMKYYELLIFSIKMGLIRKSINEERKIPKDVDLSMTKSFRTMIPFELTQDQKNVLNDIYLAFKNPHPMNMLLEGEVGSGKSIVAIISAYMAYTAGYQSLVIVPTEALAFQHLDTFSEYLEKWGLSVSLLTSSVSTKERNNILEKLRNGKINVIIGTHSLLNEEVQFKNLGFVVCDEQHKFGVEQRKILREKGNNPDVLYMTATPIPRTLSLTLFGDMQLEAIHQLPSGRKKIKTEICGYKQYKKVLEWVRSEIDDGRQAYFVTPMIEEGNEDRTSVFKVKQDLDAYFNGYKIGLLHGKMSSEEKEAAINDFMTKKTDILVSTTVIEVGINNTNASVMVIIDANNFGLSTLHQLRGRVGRGSDMGYCFLMVASKEAREKLSILEETQDGFLISEEDLRQRGPGDFLGTEQSGSLKFHYADIFDDKDILDIAIKDANELISSNDEVSSYYSKRLYSDNFD